MSVPAIALYASPPGGVCSSSPIGSLSSSSSPGGSLDYDLNPRLPSSTQRPITGGLSCLFTSPSVHHVSSVFPGAGDDLWHDRPDDLASSSSYSASLKFRDQSPVSVFHAPVSCSSGGGGSGLSKSSPSFRVPWSGEALRAGRERERDRLFSGFIRNALGSCLDYESPSISTPGVGTVDVEELSFDLDEGLVDPVCEPYARDLLLGAQARHKIFYEEVVVKAFYEAEKAHRGQMRASGDPYLEHCVETAVLLAKIGANVTVVAAGLLHDTLDDSFICYDYIFGTFGTGVADLVEGVSKLSQLSKLARDNNTATRTVEADRLHTMFLAMADARAVLIKLADRLHNMVTLDALPMAKQQRFAKETLEIFVPLANRLGISSWKQQLENLCFKHLHPEMYRELSSRLIKSFDETMIAATIEKLEEGLRNDGVSYHVLSGRYKSLYSIYSKMLKKKLTVDEIHDIHGIRLIVENEEECYRALHVVHQLWPEVVGKLKDYITHPKFNGYRSLHAVVVSGELPLEVQIRTREMHLQAEFGFAAHWRYKEAECKHSAFVLQMVEWARWVVTWQCETMNQDRPPSCGDSSLIRPPCPFPSHSDDCPYSYARHHDHEGPVFIILLENDKMSVQEFPADSTVMDLLERTGRCNTRWSPYDFSIKEELRPKLNQEPVDNPHQKLKMGDVVEMTPVIPDKSLTEYREEIQRMYDQGLPAPSQAGWRR